MLGLKGRRVLLSVHILLNAIWIGGLVAILFLNVIKGGLKSGDELYAANAIIFKLHDILLINLAFAVLTTGLLFSLFTKWGFFAFHWVTVKWLCMIVLFVLITFYLGPAINSLAAISDVERAQAAANPLYLQAQSDSTLLASIELVLLAIIIVISVFKPWGPRKRVFRVNRKLVLAIGGLLGIAAIASVLMQFAQLQKYRQMPIQPIDLATVADGNFTGEADFGFRYVVRVSLEDHEIRNIEILENRQSLYARLAEGVVKKVLQAQSPNVDAVTGATTTSKALMRAVENALAKGTRE